MTGSGHRMAALGGRDRATVIGLALSAVWLLLVALFWLFGPDGQGGASGLARLVSVIGVVMPLALIWLAVGLARAIATLRAEADDLRAVLDQMRGSRAPAPRQASAPPAPSPGFQEPRPAFANTSVPRGTVPRSAPPAPAARAPSPDQRQTAMRFDAPESVAVDMVDLIRALNFPDGPDDQTAIAALRNALKDHDTARVIRAAQDVVTLLAGNELYMDDLPPADAPAGLWRAFAEGQRGDAMGALGAVANSDNEALDIVAAMLKGDEIFRDTAHHFLRHYDLMLGRVLPQLDDDQVLVLAQTRSSRAFALIGQAAGMFG